MLRVRDAGSGEEIEVRAREVVNAAGLHAPAVAATMKGLPQRLVPRAYYARGHYFSLKGACCDLQPQQRQGDASSAGNHTAHRIQMSVPLRAVNCMPALAAWMRDTLTLFMQLL